MKLLQTFADNHDLTLVSLTFRHRSARFKGYCLVRGPLLPDGRWYSHQEVLTFEPKHVHNSGKMWHVSGLWGGTFLNRFVIATQLRRFLKTID